jgi:twitching motility protein PilJ
MKIDLKRLDSSALMFTVIGILAVSFVLMAGTFFFVARDAGYDEQYLKLVTNLRLGAQQVTQHSLRAANGTAEGFKKVEQTRTAFQQSLNLIQNGNPDTGMPATPEDVKTFIDKLSQTWKKSDSLINDLLKNRDVVVSLYERFTELTNVTKDVEANTEAMIKALESVNPTPAQMLVATRQLMILERIGNNIRRSFGGDKTAMDAEQQLGDDVAAFSEALEALRSGDHARNLPPLNHPSVQQTIDNLLTQFQEKMQSIEGFFDVSEQLFSTKDSANDLIQLTPQLLDNIEQLYNGYITAANQRLISPMLGGIFAAIVLISLALLSVMVIQSTKARAAETKRHLEESERFNRRNQEAILRLLNEISTLADGDLTINATVTEDFTGAIADALNFSIESLRDLVVSINSTAAQITESAQRSRSVATQLTDASERQAQQISKAGQAIIGMANSVKKVSANAIESAEVAKKSVEIAGKGAKTVQATIAGMDTIREQIQETSKRIKRLGESVQEIGEIVSLIDDIADQTNILALNAAIQAAMAGEAGRGFAVVADEVQRLAERASNATKQIDALVKTIQSDTHEAIGSMEQSTANVVSGAKLAESAGEALVEIETVSVKLAAQIENISQTSRTQAAVASNISGTMTIIQEITTQTSQGTNETAAAIAKLAEQANELKTSVSGFKLPDDRQQAVDEMYAF